MTMRVNLRSYRKFWNVYSLKLTEQIYVAGRQLGARLSPDAYLLTAEQELNRLLGTNISLKADDPIEVVELSDEQFVSFLLQWA